MLYRLFVATGAGCGNRTHFVSLKKASAFAISAGHPCSTTKWCRMLESNQRLRLFSQLNHRYALMPEHVFEFRGRNRDRRFPRINMLGLGFIVFLVNALRKN
jgi:hypothetical protein